MRSQPRESNTCRDYWTTQNDWTQRSLKQNGKNSFWSTCRTNHQPVSLVWTLFSCVFSWRSLWARPADCSHLSSIAWRDLKEHLLKLRLKLRGPALLLLRLLMPRPSLVQVEVRLQWGHLRVRSATPWPGLLTCCTDIKKRWLKKTKAFFYLEMNGWKHRLENRLTGRV